MMEDWTDIIGEELADIEEPLPADDWNVLQQKYAASKRKKRAAVFAWAGSLTGIAAAVALVLLLMRPGESPVMDDLTAEDIPPVEDVMSADTVADPDSVLAEPDNEVVGPVAPLKRSRPAVEIIEKQLDDEVLMAENPADDSAEEVPEVKDLGGKASDEKASDEGKPETFDVIRDTTSVNDRLMADNFLDLEDFPEVAPKRQRRPVSVGMSGSVSGTPVIRMMDVYEPPHADHEQPIPPDPPADSTGVDMPDQEPLQTRMKTGSKGYTDKYTHEIPVSIGVSARFRLTDRLSVNTGLNYTRYNSTRNRTYHNTSRSESARQSVHYLGIPVRLDWMLVNRKHFNFYMGAGMQMDKCLYATVGDERLHEKQFLFGVNGSLGFQFNIVPMVGLYFEPDFSYSLNEGSLQTFRTREPFMISARAGLRFTF